MSRIYLIILNSIWVLCFMSAGAQINQRYTLYGTVRNEASPGIIQGATITALLNSQSEIVTDSSGKFKYTLAAGSYTLEVSHVGFTKKLVHLHLTRDTAIDFTLSSQVKDLSVVIVTSKDNSRRVFSAQPGMESIDRKTALTIPAILGEVDIIKVLQLKPGIKSSGEGTSGISVRGGGTDQNLFLIDGTVVYSPNHLFGFFSTFNIDAVKDVQLYKAGFPAEFSGRLSSIVDVNTMKGTDSLFSLGGGLGLIAARLNIQGNLNAKNKKGKRFTYNIAGRRTYAEIFTSALNNAKKNDPTFNPVPAYYFYDMNARTDYILSDKDLFFGSMYYGRDYCNFDSGIFGTTFSWGNTAASIHWKHRYNDKLSMHTSFHLADYNYILRSKFDRFDFTITSGVKDYSVDSKFIYATQHHLVKSGIHITSNQFAVSKFNVSSTQSNENLASGQMINTREAGIYIADDWDAAKKWRLNVGARFTFFHNKKSYAGFEPRVSARYLLGEAFSVKASYSKMRQYKHLVASSGASLPTDIWYPSTQKIKPEVSDQVSLGITCNAGNRFLITTEVYYKWMHKLVDYKPGANLYINGNLENEFVIGKGNSYGNEISVEKTSGKLRGWIGYTLAWSIRQFAAINNGKPFYPRYDRRHELSIVASYPLSGRVSLSGSWTFYTGNAVSLPTGRTIGIDAPGLLGNNTFFNLSPVYPERNNFRMPNYHRLDIGLVCKLRTKHGSADLTFSAYNAYSRLNAYFISFKPADNSNVIAGTPAGYKAKAVTLFPIIPSVTYNFKF